jgi:hypothetical protein
MLATRTTSAGLYNLVPATPSDDELSRLSLSALRSPACRVSLGGARQFANTPSSPLPMLGQAWQEPDTAEYKHRPEWPPSWARLKQVSHASTAVCCLGLHAFTVFLIVARDVIAAYMQMQASAAAEEECPMLISQLKAPAAAGDAAIPAAAEANEVLVAPVGHDQQVSALSSSQTSYSTTRYDLIVQSSSALDNGTSGGQSACSLFAALHIRACVYMLKLDDCVLCVCLNRAV